jgi:hypothetical protein
MRNPLPLITALVALSVSLTTPAIAEPPKIEHVIGLLQQAKDSANPTPLLEKARNTLKEFHASHPLANTAAGIGAKRSANIQIGENEKKHKAMEAITKAIEAAKEGGDDVKAKIESAIAHVHAAG